MNQEFHNQLETYKRSNNLVATNVLVMKELGKILVKNRKDFIDLLNECGIAANESMSDNQLIDLYVSHIINQRLLLGTAYLVNLHNKAMNADGLSEVSDEGVKCCYDALYSNFIGGEDGVLHSTEGEEEYSYAAPVVGAIAGALGEGAKLGSIIAQNQRLKKFGAMDLLQKQQDAKAAMMQGLLAQKQAKIEADKKEKEDKSKTMRTILIVGGIVVGVAILTGVIYYIKKNK